MFHYGIFQAVDTAVKKSLSSAEASVLAAMRNVFWMAKEDSPIKKYSSLIELQKVQGCEAVTNLSVADNALYTSRASGEEFQSCVAEEIHQRLVNDLKDASMFTILVDESTDIAISKHMVMYVRVLDPHTYFLKNVTIENSRSDASVLFNCIKDTLSSDGLDLVKAVGFWF